MRVVLFTPTKRPGIDVSHFSVLRQETEAELLWIVDDLLLDKRFEVFRNFAEQDRVNGAYRYIHYSTARKKNNVTTLAESYFKAMKLSREWNADMFISMQDYIYVPKDGVQKFIDMDRDIRNEGFEKSIYTGVTSISADPTNSKIHDLNGMYTIFDEPFNEKPTDIEWCDVRYNSGHQYPYNMSSPIEFETNWACFPRAALYDSNLYFDETYDDGYAYENQDYAYRAQKNGYDLLIAYENQVISLPHKRYFPDEWDQDRPLTEVNRKRTEGRWT